MMDQLLLDTARKVFTDLATDELRAAGEEGALPQSAWAVLSDVGLTLANTSEARGGVGASLREVGEILRASANQALPLPLAETLLAEDMLAAAGLPPIEGPLTIGPVIGKTEIRLARTGGEWRASGVIHHVPWGRHLQVVTLAASPEGLATVVLAQNADVRLVQGHANEPRDRLTFTDAPVVAVGEPGRGYTEGDLRLRGALFRSIQILGALERMSELSVEYAQTRVQFGRPLAKFQAIQQQIALLATHVAACQAAVDGALEAAETGGAAFEIASAKALTSETVGLVAAIAHQVHAAMGFTREYPLHLVSRRAWAWRDEFGTEADWQRWIGRNVLALGGEGLWPFLTSPVKTPKVTLDE